MTRQLGAGLVGPHAEAEEAEAELLADRLALVEVAAGLGAGLVEILERRADELELAGRLEADRCRRRPSSAMTLPFSTDRLPAELGQRHQQVADAAGLVVGGRAMVGGR